jgi:hypothetical protein
MSTEAWGVIETVELSDGEIVDLANRAIITGIKHAINVRLGGNIDKWFYDKYSQKVGYSKQLIPFMISNSPVDPEVEVLLSGDNVTVRFEGQRLDKGESLESRLSRLEGLFADILAEPIVRKIFFWIDDGVIEKEISVDTLKGELLKLYFEGNNWEPSIKLTINKKN